MKESIKQMMERIAKSGRSSRNPHRWLILDDAHAIQWTDKVRIQTLFDRMSQYISELEDRENVKSLPEHANQA